MSEQSEPEVNLLLWMLETTMDWIPAGVWHLLVIAGFLGYFLTFVMRLIPFMGIYALPIRILSFVVLLGSVYVEGALNYRTSEEVINIIEEGNKKAENITAETDSTVKQEEEKIDKEKDQLKDQVGALFGKTKDLEAKAAEEARQKTAAEKLASVSTLSPQMIARSVAFAASLQAEEERLSTAAGAFASISLKSQQDMTSSSLSISAPAED
ncbi:hypothetical protein EBS02_10345, partial [bacterium]|nr:hypothetical protein [bacterium]